LLRFLSPKVAILPTIWKYALVIAVPGAGPGTSVAVCGDRKLLRVGIAD
jgi:hypothetical protein